MLRKYKIKKHSQFVGIFRHWKLAQARKGNEINWNSKCSIKTFNDGSILLNQTIQILGTK
jgi:hypothetical protein